MTKFSIKDWATEDRPREKLLRIGAASLSDAELLAILIGSGNKKESAVHLSQRILNSVDNNLNELGKLSVRELKNNFKGIGEAKAISISAALELGKRWGVCDRPQRELIRSSTDAHLLFYTILCDLRHEELWVAFTDRSAKLIEKLKVSQGGTSETTADIRLILKAAINALASGIILCHNHPTGNLTPSPQDDALTNRLQKTAGLMNIKLLDHIIIADKKYYSYADEGKL